MAARHQHKDPSYAEDAVQYWANQGVKFMLQTAAFHPIYTVRTLIQLGYEPEPEKPGRNLFGRMGFRRNGIVGYGRHIVNTEGVAGLYRGVAPHSISAVLYNLTKQYVSQKFSKHLKQEHGWRLTPADSRSPSNAQILGDIVVDIVSCSAAVVLAYPFQLIAVRMIAQYAGEPVLYQSTTDALASILASEGIKGLYHGVEAQLALEVVRITTVTIVFRLLQRSGVFASLLQTSTEPRDQSMLAGLEKAVATAATTFAFYPFDVSCTLLAVAGTSLAVANQPWNPQFSSLTDVLSYLRSQDSWGGRGLMRGSSILFRFFKTPLPTPSATKSAM